jgi:predicted site-specific integrase-resolvase
MKLSTYAKEVLGVTYQTAWKWWKTGKLPHKASQTETGAIIVHYRADEIDFKNRPSNVAAIYARVSSPEKKSELDTQAERLSQYSSARGYQIAHVVKEIGSGINDSRPKLTRLLRKTDYGILLVEHKDRLARFGINYMTLLLEMLGVKLEVVNVADNSRDELMLDLIAIITSFCARIYGRRRSTRKTEKLIAELQNGKNVNKI